MEILIRVPLFCSNRNESLARSVQFSRALTETPVPLVASCSDRFFVQMLNAFGLRNRCDRGKTPTAESVHVRPGFLCKW